MHFYSVYKQYLAFYAKLIPWEIYILRKIGAYQLIINGMEIIYLKQGQCTINIKLVIAQSQQHTHTDW